MVMISEANILYLKLFVIATAFISVMIYPFATSSNYLLWALLLYMIDQEITSKLSKADIKYFLFVSFKSKCSPLTAYAIFLAPFLDLKKPQ